MLIEFSYLCEKYKFIPRGIIHIGAHDLEEQNSYLSKGVNRIVWIEGNSDLVEKNQSKVDGINQQLFNGIIYSEDDLDLDFNITNNTQSSSVLNFSKHREYHPEVKFIETRKVKTVTIQTILGNNKIPPDEFDFINLDIQGVELRALKGFGKYLENIKYIYTEINSGEVYQGNDTIKDLDDYLENFGFERVESRMTPFEWGDAFYIRKNQ